MARTHDFTFQKEIPSFEAYQPRVYEWLDLGIQDKGYINPEHYQRVGAEVKPQVSGLKYHRGQTGYGGVYVIKFDAPEKMRESISESAEDRLRPFEDAINSSHKIVDIEDNWDSEGSPGYSEATWHRATSFVRNVAATFLNSFTTIRIEPPAITPGPDGSIDVRWVSTNRTILINFPTDENAAADFFGHDKGKDTLKGTLDLASQNHWLLLWLTR